MLNLNDVLCFVRVVDHQGFAEASRRLGVPKSTLSKRVAALEESLGVRLIHRTSRGFTVTAIGQEFYRRAKAMSLEAEAAEHVIERRRVEPAGPVRITASVPTVQIHLARLLPDLARTHPRIRIELHATDRRVDLAREGFDIGIRDHFAPLADSTLVQRRLRVDPVFVIGSSEYLRRRGVPGEPADLSAHDGLLTAPTATVWSLKRSEHEPVDVRPLPRLVADESHVLLHAAVAGLGLTCLPHELCRSALQSGAVVRILPEWTAGSVTTTLLLPSGGRQLPSVRAVVDFLVNELSPSGGSP